MATTNLAQALIGIVLVLSGAAGGNIADYYTSETKVCTNGVWQATSNPYEYICSTTKVNDACYKLTLTKKTCYMLDKEALAKVVVSGPKDCQYRPQSYCCGKNGCEEITWQ